jgi:hypothetical protein
MRAVSITNIPLKPSLPVFGDRRQGNTAVMRAKVALLLTSTPNYEFGCCIFPAVRALDIIRIGKNPRRTAGVDRLEERRFIPVVVVR